MKLKFFKLVALMLFAGNLYAAVGCQSKTRGLKEWFDTKTLHYVSCNCPCNTALTRKSTCPECKHYRNTGELVIITALESTTPSIQTIYLPPSMPPYKLIEQLVNKYSNRK